MRKTLETKLAEYTKRAEQLREMVTNEGQAIKAMEISTAQQIEAKKKNLQAIVDQLNLASGKGAAVRDLLAELPDDEPETPAEMVAAQAAEAVGALDAEDDE